MRRPPVLLLSFLACRRPDTCIILPRTPLSAIQDYHLVEKLAQFDRERIPERVVHARGASAKGFFEVSNVNAATNTLVFCQFLRNDASCPTGLMYIFESSCTVVYQTAKDNNMVFGSRCNIVVRYVQWLRSAGLSLVVSVWCSRTDIKDGCRISQIGREANVKPSSGLTRIASRSSFFFSNRIIHDD